MAAAEVLTHTVGTKAWIKDAEEGWIKCDVVKVDPGLLTVKTERGTVVQAKPDECPLQNPLARAGVEVRLFHTYALARLDGDFLQV